MRLFLVVISGTYHQVTTKNLKNQMNSHRFVDAVIVFCIVATILFFKSLGILLTFKLAHVIKSERELLLKKTNKELKLMLGGIKGISRFTKPQLVDLLLV